MTYIAEQILEGVSYALVERIVNAGFPAPLLASPSVSHIAIVSPAIYVGAQLIAGAPGAANVEVVTVTGVDATGFTARFLNKHPQGDPIRGATFSSGQLDNPLFTQAEVLGYLASGQNDFLLRTRCIYSVLASTYRSEVRFYDQPADAVRMERISAANAAGKLTGLFNTSQEELDMLDSSWMSEEGPFPLQWFQDEINTGKYGLRPLPSVGGTDEIWYSRRGPTSLGLLDTLIIPDCAAHYLKYRVLGRCFAKDGEQRNALLAEYCYRRYKFGLMLISKFMLGVQVGLQQGVPAAIAFNPMAAPDPQNPATQPPPESADNA